VKLAPFGVTTLYFDMSCSRFGFLLGPGLRAGLGAFYAKSGRSRTIPSCR
jgi:hypothetical protein